MITFEKKIVAFFIFTCCLFIKSADIGSDSSPVRFSTQQVVFNGDRIASFASLEGGFRFFGAQADGTFDSFFPVSGTISLNGGELTLDRDLIIVNNAVIGGLGDIVGNGHTLEFPSSVRCIPFFDDESVSCNVVLTTSINLDSDGEVVDWSFDDRFLAVGKDSRIAAADTVELYEFLPDKTLMLRDSFDPQGTRSEINDIRWHPTEYIFAMVRYTSAGDEVVTYTVNTTTGIASEIDSASLVSNAKGCVWHPDGDILAVSSDTDANELVFYPVDAFGNLGTRTTFNITPNRNPEFEAISFSPDGHYLAVGLEDNGGTSPELLVYEFTKSPITLNLVASRIFGTDVEAVDWNPTFTGFIAVGLDGTGGDLAQVDRFTPGVSTIDTAAFGIAIGGPVAALAWRNDGRCLSVGRGLTSSNHFLRTYAFDPVGTTTMRIIVETLTEDDVEAVRWSPSGNFLAAGRDGVEIPGVGALLVYENALSFAQSSCFDFNNVKMKINCDMCVDFSCIQFSGNSVIDGNGNVLSLDSTSTFLVGSNSSLLIKDVILKDLSGVQLTAVDNSSTVSFQNVKMIVDGDFTFTVGRFDVIRDFEIAGDGFNFAYQTDQVSTVSTCGRLILDEGMTFSYDPSSGSRNLLNFVDDSSELILKSATLHATANGLQLTRGYMQVEGNSFLSTEGTTGGTSIQFGDGLSSANNFCVEWLPAANLEILQGYVTYDNV